MINTSNKLKFSVITPSYNQGEYIEKTITSIINQNYSNFEHIVIDGGSNDRTIAILKKYPHIRFISEADEGQADAVNKGLKMATGDIIAWINSDDWYEPDIFVDIEDCFSNNPDKMVVMGDCNLVNERGNIFNKVVNEERGYKELRKYWVGRSIPTQPAIFFRKTLIDEFGYLDKSLYYAMDYDLWIRFSKKHWFYRLDRTFANYRFHADAKGGDQDWTKFEPDWKLVYKRHVNLYDKLIDRLTRFLAK